MDSETRDLVNTWRDMASANRELAVLMDERDLVEASSTFRSDAAHFDAVADRREAASSPSWSTPVQPLFDPDRPRAVFGRRILPPQPTGDRAL